MTYAPAITGAASTMVSPVIASPEGGDSFGFAELGGGVSSTEMQPNGAASIDATSGLITFTPTLLPAPGSTGLNVFEVSDTDALGATTNASASITVDGGSLVTYAPMTAGASAVAETPSILSPEGGDKFDLVLTSGGVALSETQAFGETSINAATGAVTFTPSAAPMAGSTVQDNVIVSDTDAYGVTTTTSVQISIEGGSYVDYGQPPVAGTSSVTDTPSLISPAGGDTFAFVLPVGSDLATTETGVYGTASIDPTTGVVTYARTSSPAPGTEPTDSSTVTDTDAKGVTTTTAANIFVDGGAAVTYTPTFAFSAAAVMEYAQTASIEGGVTFAFELPSGGGRSLTETGALGTASINPQSGDIIYTPTASSGSAGLDFFTVAATDALGVTTTTTATLGVDNWMLGYATPPIATTSAVMDAPIALSPAGGDNFAFVLNAGGSEATTAAGAFGTAVINPTTGVITYTPSPTNAPGQLDADTFSVVDSDALLLPRMATVSFQVDPGSALRYPNDPLVVVGANAGTDVPMPNSAVGGDSYAFSLPNGAGTALTEAGTYGTATIDASTGFITYTPTAPLGSVGTDIFTVSDTDRLGVTTTTAASIEVDNWALSYATPPIVATSAVTEAPTTASPAGGNSYAFILPAGEGHSTTEAGLYGAATINPTTGAITFAPSSSNSPGVVGFDFFQVVDTDALGAISQATVSFRTDTGTSLHYFSPAVVAGTSPVTDLPAIFSPEGGDVFAFVLPASAGLSLTETGVYGTAAINQTTGVITYTPTALGTTGIDAFTVSDTDALGVTTTATADFHVDAWALNYATPTVAGTSAVTEVPAMLSPAGGDNFAFILPAGEGEATTEIGNYGTAYIDPTTGVITYTPSGSAMPGQLGDDRFAVTDTDALGVTVRRT